MGWTVGQQAAIDRRNANILVSAAAGSGKTAVLTERVFKRILGSEDEEGIDIDRFLIVTFTSAAAQEMKERIADKLSEEIQRLQEMEEKVDCEAKLAYLEKQLSLIGKASISTIHSFCLKIVKNYFNHLEIDPNVKVGDESDLHLMKLELIEELLEELFEGENQEAFLSLADTYGSVRGMEPLIELVLDLHNFSKSTIFPELWLDEMSHKLLHTYPNVGDSIWDKALIKDMLYDLCDLEKMYDEAIQIARNGMGLAPYEAVLKEDLRQINDITQVLPKDVLDTLEEQHTPVELKGILSKIEVISFGRLPTVKKQEVDIELQARVKAYRDLAKKVVESAQYKANLLGDSTLRIKTGEAGKLMQELVHLIKLFDTRYSQAKRDKNIVDYNDLEHMCLKLLVTHEQDEKGNSTIGYTEVAEELSQFYAEIYIDEYQDSNMVQETLLGSIANAKKDGPTRFMVGDMKQSIYRFRLANPLIFANKYESFDKHREGDVNDLNIRKDVCIDLSQNFRSRSIILDATNDLFEQIMSKEVGELVYDEDAKLKVGNHYDQGDIDSVADSVAKDVEVHLVETGGGESRKGSENSEATSEEDDEDLKSIEIEARMVADIISGLVRGEGSVKQIFDKEIGDYRPVEARDIVILLRSVKNKATLFEEALLERGVGAYADVAANFFEAIEIQTILSYLHIIDNPRQDIPLLTVLRSPIVRVDFDQILQIRKYDESTDFYGAMVKYIEDGLAPESIVKFYDMLCYYRVQSTLIPLEDLMNMLFIDTGYYRYVSLLPAGAKKKANLKMLKKYAEDFENNTGVGLFNFLQHMKKLESTGANVREAKLVGENENLVRIMTIHKSKGLEFPIVFVCNTDKKFNNQDIMKSVLMHHQLGLGPKFIDETNNVLYETVPFHAIKNKIVSENISEEVRVLYVALTRAKEKLYLTGTVKNMEKQLDVWSQFAIRNGKNIVPMGLKRNPTYLNWIGMSLFANNTFEDFRNSVSVPCDYLFKGKGEWRYTLWQKDSITSIDKNLASSMEDQKKVLQEWDTEKVHSDVKDTIHARLSYQYPHQKATELPVKVAVSQLKKKQLVKKEIKKEIEDNQIQEYEKVSKSKNVYQESIKEIPTFIQKETHMKATTRGTIIHSVFEHLDLMRFRTVEAISGEIDRLISDGKLVKEAKELASVEILVDVANTPMLQRMREAKHVWKEKAFVYLAPAKEVDLAYPEDEEILVQGVVDTCFIEENGLVLVDYKTDYVDPAKREQSIEGIKERYKIQLDLYALALGSISNTKVTEKWLYLYSVNEWVQV